jgi:cytochrome P450
VTTSTSVPEIPAVPGLPLLGNTIQLAKDPYGFLRRCLHTYGPVFRIDLMSQRPVVLAGPEANLLLKQTEHTHFAAAPAFEPLARALGARRFLLTLDGAPHKELRDAVAPAMSHKQLERYVPRLAAIAGEHLQRLANGRVFDVRDELKRLVYAQLGGVLTNIDADEFYGDIVRVFDTALRVSLTKVWPWFALYNPMNLYSRRRLRVLGKRLMASVQDGATIPDLVQHAAARGILEPDDLLATLLAPYFAGIDTVAASLSFAFHAVAAHPEQVQRVRVELDADEEPLTLGRLRELPLLRAFVLETLRCHPITLLVLRHTTRAVEFAGHRIEADTLVGFPVALPHKCPEYFADPDAFDLDRFPGGRANAAPGVYQPFGAGAHACLGAGLADVQMLVVLATLLRDYDLGLHPTDYVLRQSLAPLPVPKRLRARLQTRARN